MLIGTFLGASFLVTGIGAWYLIKGTHQEFARKTFSMGLGVIAILIPLQLFVGDSLAVFMGGHQPAKLQAIEGNWGSTNTGYNIIVVPDQENQRNTVQIAIPCLGSAIVGDWSCSSPTPGLAETAPDQQPPMVFTFWAFRVMFFIAIGIFAITAIGIVLRLRGKLYSTRWFHWLALSTIPAGILAVIGGWITSETGRQPWVVYGQLLTSDAVSPLSPYVVLGSLIAFAVIYTILLSLYVYYIVRLVRAGPDDPEATATAPERSPSRPGREASSPEASVR